MPEQKRFACERASDDDEGGGRWMESEGRKEARCRTPLTLRAGRCSPFADASVGGWGAVLCVSGGCLPVLVCGVRGKAVIALGRRRGTVSDDVGKARSNRSDRFDPKNRVESIEWAWSKRWRRGRGEAGGGLGGVSCVCVRGERAGGSLCRLWMIFSERSRAAHTHAQHTHTNKKGHQAKQLMAPTDPTVFLRKSINHLSIYKQALECGIRFVCQWPWGLGGASIGKPRRIDRVQARRNG